VAEAVLTFMFLLVILGSTDRRAPAGFAPLAIGLALTLIHLVSCPGGRERLLRGRTEPVAGPLGRPGRAARRKTS
jgi:hypothetical protein